MTPKYVFSKKKLEECYYTISSKMKGVKIFYSLKANSEEKVLQVLKDIDANFEVASIGEFKLLKKLNVNSDRIICGLPVKPIEWIQYMYSMGCLYYVFDNTYELKKLIKYAPVSKKILRINICDIIPNSIEFGMNYCEAIALLSQDSEMRDYVDGLSFHISDNVNILNFNNVLDRIETLLPLFSLKGIVLNIGGGYRLDASEDFYENIQVRVHNIKQRYNVDIIAEPGNTIVNSAGSIYTTVIGLKEMGFCTDVYIDAGKPSGIKTDYKRIPGSITIMGKSKCSNKYRYRFIDITCMHKPHFSCELEYIIEVGDLLIFNDMGAYSICLQNKFHLWEAPEVEIVI